MPELAWHVRSASEEQPTAAMHGRIVIEIVILIVVDVSLFMRILQPWQVLVVLSKNECV